MVSSTLDAIGVYWQLLVVREDKDSSNFTSYTNIYRFNKTFFGIMNAQAPFQSVRNVIHNKQARKSCLVYLDGIIIVSKDHDWHLQDVENVLSALHAANVLLKLKECH